MTHSTPSTQIWPLELIVSRDKRLLTIKFDDGTEKRVSAEYLRIESPSAEVQGHHASQKVIVTGKENVKIVSLDPVGNYAVRITFDDGHNSGFYTWHTLAQMSPDYHSKSMG